MVSNGRMLFLLCLHSRAQKKVVFEMEHNKAPDLDGFLVEFYQNMAEQVRATWLSKRIARKYNN